ncbi:choline transporter [Fusarium pseudocircinatum]|uniref:Choline transporter n=1 Tax=Fusarium pseudocircinatum TaxID=56676 RepID=A0A8H5KHP5_9HYPO|nr:choline transporter [Fusarium pseudocircinatum]
MDTPNKLDDSGLRHIKSHGHPEPQHSSTDEPQHPVRGHSGDLPQRFSPFATLATAFSITNSWAGVAVVSAVLAIPLYAGAGPGALWAPIVSCSANLLVAFGLAEHASAFPSNGGQYHFTFMVSPDRYRLPLAFLTGWISVFAWLFSAASVGMFCAQVCMSIVFLYHPTFIAARWQTYLVYTVIMALVTLYIAFVPRAIPLSEKVFFWASVVGIIVSITTVLAVSDTKQTPRAVFLNFVNLTGWNDGVAFLLAVSQSGFGFGCIDAATHISEELPNPDKNVPRAMYLTLLMGLGTSVPFVMSLLFSCTDFQVVASSELPILEIYLQATGSKAGATVLTLLILLVFIGSAVGATLTAGRLLWAFARDNGVFYADFFGATNRSLQTPVNATLLAGGFCVLYGLIYIGSVEAYNSSVATAVLSLNITYMIPQAIALMRGREKTLPARYFNLGRIFGPVCNIFAILYVSLLTVVYFMPSFLPVTTVNMNYAIVVMAAAVIFIIAMWFIGGRNKTFVGPVAHLNGLALVEGTSNTV